MIYAEQFARLVVALASALLAVIASLGCSRTPDSASSTKVLAVSQTGSLILDGNLLTGPFVIRTDSGGVYLDAFTTRDKARVPIRDLELVRYHAPPAPDTAMRSVVRTTGDAMHNLAVFATHARRHGLSGHELSDAVAAKARECPLVVSAIANGACEVDIRIQGSQYDVAFLIPAGDEKTISPDESAETAARELARELSDRCTVIRGWNYEVVLPPGRERDYRPAGIDVLEDLRHPKPLSRRMKGR